VFKPAQHPSQTDAQKGRGTAWRVAHRFERDQREWVDDGWADGLEAEDRAPIKTQVSFQPCVTAISTNDSPDISFDAAVNPYRGCEHGCIYCYARPTHSYLGLSPGLDFETQIIAKPNIAEALTRDLAKPSYKPQHINIGSATDCYQPCERELKLTHSVIGVLAAAKNPFSIITKSALIERDIDLVAPLAQAKLAAVYVTITSLDGDLIRKLEPRAAAPHRRLQTIRRLVEAGIPVGVSVAPQIPFVNEDMEATLEAAAEAGARRAFYTVLRLPWELDELFEHWLAQHLPDRAERVMARVRDLRGGKNYGSDWGQRMKGQGIWADLYRQRFLKACQRLGLNNERFELDASQFVRPERAEEPKKTFTEPSNGQQSLF
jgi:DNA repair photolyase